jgi:TatD DNase family protein
MFEEEIVVYSDSHCHLDRYEPELLINTLKQAKRTHVNCIISQAMSMESSVNTAYLAQSHQEVYVAIGIHPWNAIPLTAEVQGQLRQLAEQDKVVAIGEIGLDYLRNPETKEIQKELLEYELWLSRETGLPANIHCREAHQDMMDILRANKDSGLKGIIHGFTGNLSELEDWLDMGFYISIGRRIISGEDISSLEQAVREIPLNRLLTETDGNPIDVIKVVQKLASITGISDEQLSNAAIANLRFIHRIG